MSVRSMKQIGITDILITSSNDESVKIIKTVSYVS